eukprot:g716.t1
MQIVEDVKLIFNGDTVGVLDLKEDDTFEKVRQAALQAGLADRIANAAFLVDVGGEEIPITSAQEKTKKWQKYYMGESVRLKSTAKSRKVNGAVTNFVPLRKILCSCASLFGIQEIINMFSVNKGHSVYVDESFYRDLMRGCWPGGPLSLDTMQGVALKRKWAFSSGDGFNKRLFIASFIADYANQKEDFPLTVKLTFSTSMTCTQLKEQMGFLRRGFPLTTATTGSSPAMFLGTPAKRLNFTYRTQLLTGESLRPLGPICKAAKKLQIIRVGAMIHQAEGKGFALRTLEEIQNGEFVCEYLGEYAPSDSSWRVPRRYAVGFKSADSLGSGAGAGASDVSVAAFDRRFHSSAKPRSDVMINAIAFGNASRFMNHSHTSANLIATVEPSEDGEHSHVKFFASRKIAPQEELRWNYRDTSDQNHRPKKHAPATGGVKLPCADTEFLLVLPSNFDASSGIQRRDCGVHLFEWQSWYSWLSQRGSTPDAFDKLRMYGFVGSSDDEDGEEYSVGQAYNLHQSESHAREGRRDIDNDEDDGEIDAWRQSALDVRRFAEARVAPWTQRGVAKWLALEAPGADSKSSGGSAPTGGGAT